MTPNCSYLSARTTMHDTLTDARRRLINWTGAAPEEHVSNPHILQLRTDLTKMEHAFVREKLKQKHI